MFFLSPNIFKINVDVLFLLLQETIIWNKQFLSSGFLPQHWSPHQPSQLATFMPNMDKQSFESNSMVKKTANDDDCSVHRRRCWWWWWCSHRIIIMITWFTDEFNCHDDYIVMLIMVAQYSVRRTRIGFIRFNLFWWSTGGRTDEPILGFGCLIFFPPLYIFPKLVYYYHACVLQSE